MDTQGDERHSQRHVLFPFGTAPVTREMAEDGDVGLYVAHADPTGPRQAPPPPQQPEVETEADKGLLRRLLVFLSHHHISPRRGYKNEHHRLINEDFFTDPIRKLLRDGSFPFKLVVNCLMLLLLVLIAVICHVPETIANEEQRKAVLHLFMGDNYIGKDKGNIKLRPTVYLHKREDVLDDIEEFVKVYYALANTSVSELHYYYYAVSEDGASILQKMMEREVPVSSDCFEVIGNKEPHDFNDLRDLISRRCVLPVTMEVDAYLYSQREYRGSSPLRHFSVQLTEKDPLGPFSSDREEEGEGEKRAEGAKPDPLIQSEKQLDLGSPTRSASNHDHGAAPSDKDMRSVCAPRYDEIAGLYYIPCREAPGTNETNSTHGESGKFRFPLMDNVDTIRLKASIRHLTDSAFNRREETSGFENVIYHWFIEKVFSFHAGGLVEVEFMMSVVTRRIFPCAHPRFFFSAVLLLLAAFDIVLRYRALRRIATSRKRVAVPQESLPEEGSVDSFSPGKSRGSSTFPLTYATPPDASLRVPCDPAAPQAPPNLPKLPPRQRKPTTRKVKHVPRAGSLVPETVYTDFYDAWREQLQSSRGESWHYIALVADVLALAYIFTTSVRLWGISTPELYNTVESIFLGITGLLLSVNLLSYIRYFPQMYFAVRAMRSVVPRLLGFAMSVAPIFVGFALFFCIVFGPHSNGEFSDMGFSLVALYFVMFGDAILPAIDDAGGSVYVIVNILANFMTMVFILFFMMTMLNLAMAITQHEWGLLRRRFGSCLSANNLLFEVRTRDEVKAEAMEVVIANMELLLHIKSEERLTADASHGHHADDINDGSGCTNDTVGGLLNPSRSMQGGDVAEMYRRRLDELTEGIANEGA